MFFTRKQYTKLVLCFISTTVLMVTQYLGGKLVPREHVIFPLWSFTTLRTKLNCETNKQTNTPTEVSLEPQLCMFTVALRQFQFLAVKSCLLKAGFPRC